MEGFVDTITVGEPKKGSDALIRTAGLTGFMNDRIDQYLLLTNTSVQNFYYYPKKSPPAVSFHLYDEFKEMF